jgi:hypothetical protein
MAVGAIVTFADDELVGFKILSHEMATATLALLIFTCDQFTAEMCIQQLSRLCSHIPGQKWKWTPHPLLVRDPQSGFCVALRGDGVYCIVPMGYPAASK